MSRVCPGCGGDAVDARWRCPDCGAAAEDGGAWLRFPHAGPSFPPAFYEAANGGAEGAGDGAAIAREAGSFWYRARGKLIRALVRRFAPEARSVMEIGCGTGSLLAGVGSVLPAASLTGSDGLAGALAAARRRLGPAATLVQADAAAALFRREFDLMLACDVLEHIVDDRGVLAVIRQQLHPGGTAILTVPQHAWMWGVYDEVYGHQRRYPVGALRRVAAAAGLPAVFATSFNVLPFPAMVVRRWLGRQRTAAELEAEFHVPPLIDRGLERLLDVERMALHLGLSWPFGGSQVVVVRRR